MRNFVRPAAASRSLVSLNGLAREIVELCRFEVANSAAEIVLDLAAVDDDVLADAIHVQQVLVNLVQNALQAMKAAESSVRTITIRTSSTSGHVRVDVVDTGPGISLADESAAFDPFQSTKPDGLGIGLAICRTIVDDHRGQIWIESSTATGTHVAFQLPQAASRSSHARSLSNCICC